MRAANSWWDSNIHWASRLSRAMFLLPKPHIINLYFPFLKFYVPLDHEIEIISIYPVLCPQIWARVLFISRLQHFVIIVTYSFKADGLKDDALSWVLTYYGACRASLGKSVRVWRSCNCIGIISLWVGTLDGSSLSGNWAFLYYLFSLTQLMTNTVLKQPPPRLLKIKFSFQFAIITLKAIYQSSSRQIGPAMETILLR